MMQRLATAFSLATPLAVAVAWYHLFGETTRWSNPVHWAASAVLAAVALATALATLLRSPRAQVSIAAGLIIAQLVIMGSTVAGVRFLAYNLFPDRRLTLVVGGLLALAAYGLLRGRLWGRSLSLALGAVGAVSGGLNIIQHWSVTTHFDPQYAEWSTEMFEKTWVLCVSALGGALIIANLASRAVRDRFVASARGTTWTSGDRLVGLLRWTLLATFAAVPMLLVYAWLQPIVPSTRLSALALAATLSLAAALASRGKLIGAWLLVAAGGALVAQTAVTALRATAEQRGIAGYYAIFWLPAALLAILCGARLLGPTLRLLRRS